MAVATIPVMDAVNIADRLSRIAEPWSPHIIGEVNDFLVKAVRFEGEFCWHSHATEDELFLVITGTLVMRFRDREVTVNPGEFIVVPHGVEHCPVTPDGCEVLLFEPKSTLNTGDVRNELTREVLERL